MTTLIDSRCPGYSGRLIPITTNQALPALIEATLRYEDAPDTNLLTRIGVATKLEVSQQIAAQFQNALTDVIYVTPFGDRADTISLTFISNRECLATGSDLRILDHYLNYRLLPGGSEATALPATVTVGSAAFRAYLVGMALSASASEQMVSGTLVFKGWPA